MATWEAGWDAEDVKGSPSAYRTCRLQPGLGSPWLKFFGNKIFAEFDPGRRSAGAPIMGGARPLRDGARVISPPTGLPNGSLAASRQRGRSLTSPDRSCECRGPDPLVPK